MENNILQLINNGENVETECKEAGQGLPKDMWETYSSFANTNGGVILLGIKQKGDTFHVSGVETSKRLKEFWDTINNSQKVSINLLNDDSRRTHYNGAPIELLLYLQVINNKFPKIINNTIRISFFSSLW